MHMHYIYICAQPFIFNNDVYMIYNYYDLFSQLVLHIIYNYNYLFIITLFHIHYHSQLHVCMPLHFTPSGGHVQ